MSKREVTIEKICHGLRILEKYNPKATVYGKNSAQYAIELQEEEFGNITEEDKQLLFALNWETNGYYLWYI